MPSVPRCTRDVAVHRGRGRVMCMPCGLGGRYTYYAQFFISKSRYEAGRGPRAERPRARAPCAHGHRARRPSSARAPAHRQDTRTTRPRVPPRTAACISYTQSLVLMHRTSQALNVACLSASTLRLSPRLHTHQWKSAVRPATEALVVLVISPSVSPKLTPGLPVMIIRVRPVHPRLLLDRGAMRRDTSDVQTEDRDRRGGCLASDRLNERRP